MDGNEEVLKTLLYSDIFDYPLTKEEIFKFLISEKKISKQNIFKIIDSSKNIKEEKGYYFIGNKNEFVEKRVDRINISFGKRNLAKKIIKMISLIPTINLIGISGALSMNNSKAEDDIDIFVICQ